MTNTDYTPPLLRVRLAAELVARTAPGVGGEFNSDRYNVAIAELTNSQIAALAAGIPSSQIQAATRL